MLIKLLNAIINYDPEASTTSKVDALNELLAELIALIEKWLEL